MPQAPIAFKPHIIRSKGAAGQALSTLLLMLLAAGCRGERGTAGDARRVAPSPAAAIAARPEVPIAEPEATATAPAAPQPSTDPTALAPAETTALAETRATLEAVATADGRATEAAFALARELEASATPVAAPTALDLPGRVEIPGLAHTWQKWNNCGPSSIAMALSAYGLQVDQLAAASELKPDREDTNVSPEELAEYARRMGLRARAGVGGDLDLVRGLLRAGVPVLAEQWIGVEGRGEMGHYRVLSGYDDPARELIAQDSYYGANQRFDYDAFETMWRPFLGAYVIAWRPEQDAAVRTLLGEAEDSDVMWRRALAAQQAWVDREPGSAWAWFALGEALAQTGDHAGAVAAFDRARGIGLPFRAFWYQFGYYRSLFEIGDYARVVALADETLAPMKGENLEESHYWKGRALEGLGKHEDARASYRRALEFNPRFAPAAEALAAAGG